MSLRMAGLIVFLIPALVFLPSLSLDFVLDDSVQVTQNPAVRDLDLGKIFGQGYWANASEAGRDFGKGGDLYRPFTTLSIAVSHQFFGESPRGYHAENVLFHALAALLVFVLLLRWKLPFPAAVFAALLFGVAPVHIEPVASVILRNELLAGIFSLVFLIGLTSRRRLGPWLIAPVALLAALLTKESTIALPFLGLLADWIFVRPRWWRPRLAVYGLLGAVCVLYLGLRLAALDQIVLADPEVVYFGRKSTLVVWLTMARFATERYLSGALFGAPLVFDYSPVSFPDARPSDPWAWLSLIAWVGLGVSTLFFAVRKRAWWTFGPLFFLLALGPTANLITRIGVIGATRLLYLPYLGVAVTLALAGAAVARRLGRRRAVAVLVPTAAVILIVMIVQTERRLVPWKHPYTLYADIVTRAPGNGIARINLGNRAVEFALDLRTPPEELLTRSDREWAGEAFDHYAAGLRAYPRNFSFVITNLVYAAIHGHKEENLTILLDHVLREAHPGSRFEDLPAGEWEQRGPLTEADQNRLVAWAESLRFLDRSRSDDRILYSLCRALPGLLRTKSYERALRRMKEQGATATELERTVQESARVMATAHEEISALAESPEQVLVMAARSLGQNLLAMQERIRKTAP